MSILACSILTLTLLAFIFWPERTLILPASKTRLDYLRERKDVIYENLRDLNFEYRSGKYPEEDYAAQRASLENEAADVLAEIETLERIPTA
ncbi:MAG: hypothetical protein ACYC46_13190 [Acidobacteriaceae bacterium]